MAKPLRILIADDEELNILREEVNHATAGTPVTLIEAAIIGELEKYLGQNESQNDYLDLAIVDVHMDPDKIDPRTYRITAGYHKIGRETPAIFVTGKFEQEILSKDGVPQETGLLLPHAIKLYYPSPNIAFYPNITTPANNRSPVPLDVRVRCFERPYDPSMFRQAIRDLLSPESKEKYLANLAATR